MAAPQVVARVMDVSVGSVMARIDTWRLPTSKTKRAQLAPAYGSDGLTLLNAVHAATGCSAWGWRGCLRWRCCGSCRAELCRRPRRPGTGGDQHAGGRTDGLPPGRPRITSPYDLDAR